MQTVNATNLNEVLKTLEQHPLAKAILDEKKAETQSARTTAKAAINAAIKQQGTELSPLNDDIARAEATLHEARDTLKAAEQALAWAVHKKRAKAIELSAVLQQQEVFLRETAPVVINETIIYFRDKLDALRQGGISSQDFPGKKDTFTEKRKPYAFSNVAAVRSALEYSRDAIEKLEAMKLDVLEETELTARLAELKNATPGTAKMILYE